MTKRLICGCMSFVIELHDSVLLLLKIWQGKRFSFFSFLLGVKIQAVGWEIFFMVFSTKKEKINYNYKTEHTPHILDWISYLNDFLRNFNGFVLKIRDLLPANVVVFTWKTWRTSQRS